MTGIIFFAILPSAPLLQEALTASASDWRDFDQAFVHAISISVFIAVLSAVFGFVLGSVVGVVAVAYDFPGRTLLMVVVALPLFLPPFLSALGWEMLLAPRTSGLFGVVLVFGLWITPLVALSAVAAGSGLSATAIDAARLGGGEWRAMALTLRYVLVPSLAAAGLGAALTIADPGPGQVFGTPTVAFEMLTSFAALNDYGLAARQSLVVAALVLTAAIPFAWFAAPHIASALLARQTRKAQRRRLRGRMKIVAAITMLILFVALTLAPVAGLARPLTVNGFEWFFRAFSDATRTATNTLVYGAGAGLIAVFLGFTLALATGRSARMRRFTIAACFALLSMPPALVTLGIIQIASAAPAWTDPLVRGRFIVCFALGLHLFPIAAVLALRSWATFSPSWSYAGAVQGVSLPTFLVRIMVSHLLPAMGAAFLLVGILAIADIGSTLLLHPPGAASFPLAIFTVMANAPEALVASLALLYVGSTAGLLFLAWGFVEMRSR